MRTSVGVCVVCMGVCVYVRTMTEIKQGLKIKSDVGIE